MRLLCAAFFLWSCKDQKDTGVEPGDSGGADTGPTGDCPALVVYPDKLSLFGPLGATTVVPLSLSNTCTGTGALTISEVALEDETGTLSLATPSLPIVLEPGRAAELYVAFVSRSYDPVSATLVLTSDDADGGMSISVSATANPDQDGDGALAMGAGGDDCNDLDPGVNPDAGDAWYDGVDSNCDGLDDYDADRDSYRAEEAGGFDCDDAAPDVNPGAPERWYDGVDQDCDGQSDFDQDGDGLEGGPGGEDCDDTDPELGLGGDEVWYDGEDQDCDGWSDYDQDYDGFDSADYGGDDCDDLDADISPGVDETWYDGVDQDCSGGGDYDADGDGLDSADWGGEDCDDTDADAYPGGSETWYDGVDGDCSGGSDYDYDADGEDSADWGGLDCDDADPDVYAGREETWYDGVDGDCSGGSDYDADGDGWDAEVGGGEDCDDTDPDLNPDAEEAWDGRDSDCDGVGDDAVVTEVASVALTGDAGDGLGYPAGLSVGDLDGDGVDDLLVGSLLADSEAGGAWLLSGADYEGWSGALSDLAVASFGGSRASNRLAALGERQDDIDGDGVADLVIGGTDVYGGAAACVWLGGDLEGAFAASSADVLLYGADDVYTRVLSHLDLDGTGLAELVYADYAYGTERGRLYTVSDDALSAGGAVSMATDYTARVRGAANYDYLGSGLGGGDVDGDGLDDLLLGAPGADTGETGAVYLYLAGALTGAFDAGTSSALVITGNDDADRVGESSSAIGDVDGDGTVDLVVGAPGRDKVGVFLDAASLSGTLRFGSADAKLNGGDADLFGYGLVVADVDGDGVAEVIVGAPDARDPSAGTHAGETYVFRVRNDGTYESTDASARLEGTDGGDALGGTLAAGLDLDGNGRGDLILTAWGQDDGGEDAGTVYGVLMP